MRRRMVPFYPKDQHDRHLTGPGADWVGISDAPNSSRRQTRSARSIAKALVSLSAIVNGGPRAEGRLQHLDQFVGGSPNDILLDCRRVRGLPFSGM